MYENMNYEVIKQRILSKIQGIDKREGSFVNDMISPVSMELEGNYVELEKIVSTMFLEDMPTEALEKRCAEYGIYRKNGTYASGIGTFTGLENTVIPMNALLSTTTGLNYVTTEEKTIASGETTVDVNIKAVEVGTKFNVEANEISTLSVGINGIIGVTNKEKINGGSDIETDTELLDRLLLRLRYNATSGNATHYRLWALSVDGIGEAKVFPLWNGPGTVKVVIVTTDKEPADNELVSKVGEYIETVRPIGANVTVTSGIGKAVTVSAKIKIASGYNINTIQQSFVEYLKEKFKDFSFNITYISYAKIGTYLLNIAGVIDYEDLLVNGNKANIALTEEEIPLLDTVNLEVF